MPPLLFEYAETPPERTVFFLFMEECIITSVPYEILCCFVLSHLSAHELSSLRATCRLMKHVCSDRMLWKRLFKDDFMPSTKQSKLPDPEPYDEAYFLYARHDKEFDWASQKTRHVKSFFDETSEYFAKLSSSLPQTTEEEEERPDAITEFRAMEVIWAFSNMWKQEKETGCFDSRYRFLLRNWKFPFLYRRRYIQTTDLDVTSVLSRIRSVSVSPNEFLPLPPPTPTRITDPAAAESEARQKEIEDLRKSLSNSRRRGGKQQRRKERKDKYRGNR